MDADAVRLVLLLGSLAEKSAIVAAFARDQFHLEENVQTILTTGDLTGVHLAWAQDLVELMRSIETEAKYCRAGLDVCSVAVLHTMAAMLAEVTRVEAGLGVILQARQPYPFPATTLPLPFHNPI